VESTVHFSLELGQFYFEFVMYQIGKERSFLVSFAIEKHHSLACLLAGITGHCMLTLHGLCVCVLLWEHTSALT
jgi:hypothetical protein